MLRSLLFLAVPVALAARAGTAPAAAPWGGAPPGSPAAEAEVLAVVARVVAASSYPLKDRVRAYYYGRGAEEQAVAGRPMLARRGELKSSPAGALAPRQGLNESDSPALWVTGRIYAYARDPGEAAFLIGHELAHLSLGHHALYERAYCAEMDAWFRERGAPRTCAARTREDEGGLWDGAPLRRARLEALSREQEFEADARGAEYAAAAGADPDAPSRVLDALAASYRANGWKGDGMHPLPEERLTRLRAARR